MNWKNLAPLIAAIVLGGVAWMIIRNMSNNGNKPANTTRQLQMVIAKGTVSPGSELTSEQVGLAPVNGDTLPPGAYSTPQDVIGRIVSAPLVDGQPINQGTLAPVGTAAGLQALVPAGMRAVTIDVNEISGLAGLLAPGCRVDLVSTIIDQNDQSHTMTRAILENVLVTAVGPRMTPTKPEGEKDSTYHTVTLIVSPRQALMIELASSLAKTRLALRSHGDNAAVQQNSLSLMELRGKSAHEGSTPPVLATIAPSTPLTPSTTQPAQAAAPQAQPTWTALVVHGNSITSVDFDMPANAPDTAGTDPRPALQP